MKSLFHKLLLIQLFLLPVGLHAADRSDIVGYWSIFFPVSDEMQGYYFSENGDFYYCDYRPINVKNRYSGSKGKWKVDSNKILINIQKDVIWKKSWIRLDSGVMTEGKDNSFTIEPRLDNKWYVIGDVRLFTESKYYKDSGGSDSKPENLFLSSIVNKEVLVKTRGAYWKLSDGEKDADVTLMIQRFNK